MTDLVIEAGIVLAADGPDGALVPKDDCALLVRDGRIARIAPTAELRRNNPDLPRHGGPGMIATAGFVNSHHHFGVTPLMAGVPFAPLELWLPRFRGMRGIGPRLDTLYSAIEMLESGTTTVHHIHSGLTGAPEAWETTTQAVLDAYASAGMRVGYSFMIRDRNILSYAEDASILDGLPTDVRNWIAPQLAVTEVPVQRYMEFFRRLRARHVGNDMVRANLAPANLHWCSDEALIAIFGTARDTGAQVHMHLLETRRQMEFALTRLGKSAVRHLHDLGCLGPDLTLGHGNWTSPYDLDLLADCGCRVCHNASSGLRLGSGVAPLNEMRRRGIPVALGIDQSNIADDRDMTVEMKLVWALHRGTGLQPGGPDAAEVLRMASDHGAASAGFGGVTGRLAPGLAADVVLFDRARVERPFVHRDTPIAETLLHRARASAVVQVFVSGRQVVRDGRIATIDRDAILQEIADRLSAPQTDTERQIRAHCEVLVSHLAGVIPGQGVAGGHEAHQNWFQANRTE